jgi:hypothetical protein
VVDLLLVVLVVVTVVAVVTVHGDFDAVFPLVLLVLIVVLDGLCEVPLPLQRLLDLLLGLVAEAAQFDDEAHLPAVPLHAFLVHDLGHVGVLLEVQQHRAGLGQRLARGDLLGGLIPAALDHVGEALADDLVGLVGELQALAADRDVHVAHVTVDDRAES